MLSSIFSDDVPTAALEGYRLAPSVMTIDALPRRHVNDPATRRSGGAGPRNARVASSRKMYMVMMMPRHRTKRNRNFVMMVVPPPFGTGSNKTHVVVGRSNLILWEDSTIYLSCGCRCGSNLCNSFFVDYTRW